jgi:hypothetical protein
MISGCKRQPNLSLQDAQAMDGHQAGRIDALITEIENGDLAAVVTDADAIEAIEAPAVSCVLEAFRV